MTQNGYQYRQLSIDVANSYSQLDSYLLQLAIEYGQLATQLLAKATFINKVLQFGIYSNGYIASYLVPITLTQLASYVILIFGFTTYSYTIVDVCSTAITSYVLHGSQLVICIHMQCRQLNVGSFLGHHAGLSLMGQQVIWVNKCEPVAMLVARYLAIPTQLQYANFYIASYTC